MKTFFETAKRRLFVAGDSTAADYGGNEYPMTGWGQALPFFLRETRVVNLAQKGRSSKSFIDEGWFAIIEREIRAGDYLLVQFGHNDEKDPPELHTDPQTTFPACLRRYIDCARTHGATPVLLTPTERRLFQPDGTLQYSHGAYPEAVKKLAAEAEVLCVDLTALTRELYITLGPVAAERFFVRCKPGDYPGFPDGEAADNTHFCRYGAFQIAGLIAKELKKLLPDLICDDFTE